jgi:hypothetical protein
MVLSAGTSPSERPGNHDGVDDLDRQWGGAGRDRPGDPAATPDSQCAQGRVLTSQVLPHPGGLVQTGPQLPFQGR